MANLDTKFNNASLSRLVIQNTKCPKKSHKQNTHTQASISLTYQREHAATDPSIARSSWLSKLHALSCTLQPPFDLKSSRLCKTPNTSPTSSCHQGSPEDFEVPDLNTYRKQGPVETARGQRGWKNPQRAWPRDWTDLAQVLSRSSLPDAVTALASDATEAAQQQRCGDQVTNPCKEEGEYRKKVMLESFERVSTNPCRCAAETAETFQRFLLDPDDYELNSITNLR
ncbi:Hypothetical predicted protein [Scomber scombrus]|uniref:Uncharacterized protein n=1 Tax=Scomber scombrus TaxID=13677 RepID=A0AAV1PB40_SCOSC